MTGGRTVRAAAKAVRLARTVVKAVASPFTTAGQLALRLARRHPWIIGVAVVPLVLSAALASTATLLVVQSASDMMNVAATFTGMAGTAAGSSGGAQGGASGYGCFADLGKMQEVTRIPTAALSSYCLASGRIGVDWAILAGIGYRECAHGTDPAAGCNRDIPSADNPAFPAVNSAGARGPMQFLGSTWDNGKGAFDPDVARAPIPDGQEGKGYASDGDGDGVADPWNFPDAAVAAARLLKRNGVDTNPRQAIYAYNQTWDYVDSVLQSADGYRSAVAPLLPAGPTPGQGGYTGPKGSTAPYTEPNLPAVTSRMLQAVVPIFGRGRGIGCWGEREGPTDHDDGHACDFMMATIGTMPNAEWTAHGWAMANYLIANASSLRVKYIIWQEQIWQNGQWTRYTRYGPGGGITQNHYDHVHVSLYVS